MSASLWDGLLVGVVVAGAVMLLWRRFRPKPKSKPIEADAVLKGALAQGVKRAQKKR